MEARSKVSPQQLKRTYPHSSTHPSIYQPTHTLSTHLFIYQLTHPSINPTNPSIHLSTHPSIYQPPIICQPTHPSTNHPSIYQPPIHLSTHPSIYQPPIHLSTHPSIYQPPIHGTKMGPNYANLFVSYMERQIFNQFDSPKPEPFGRYINDCLGATFCTKEELERFIGFVNSFHPALKFTWEISETSVTS